MAKKTARRTIRHSLKKHFIPHEGNDYHPHIFHPKRTVFYGGFFLFLKAMAVTYAAFLPVEAYLAPNVLAAQSDKIYALTNEIRKENGIPPLARVPVLNYSAQMRADDMAEKSYFSHTGPDGHVLSFFLKSSGYKYSTAGENLAMGFSDADAVVAGWKKSPTHFANLVDADFLEIGVGLEEGTHDGKPTVYVAQHFGLPLNTAPAVAVTATVPPPQPTVEVETPPVQGEGVSAAAEQPVPVKLPEPPPVTNRAVATAPAAKPKNAAVPTATLVPEVSSVTWQDAGDGKTHVEVAAAVAGEPEAVTASIQGYAVALNPENGVYTGSVTIPEPSDDIFRTVIGSSIEITDSSGVVARDVLDWSDPKTISQETPWRVYRRAEAWFSPVTSFFSVLDDIYLAFFTFFSVALLISLSVEIKKQHPHVIGRTLGLLGLLIFLIWR